MRDPKRFPFNLTTVEGKKEFEDYMTDFNEKVPGAFASPGQKFDFKTYYSEIGVWLKLEWHHYYEIKLHNN